jgi:transglutaminase-like putative cysteine protease
MDFSAWHEVYLGGRWWSLDGRHNEPRIGRILMATGRDAVDVALTTQFGCGFSQSFSVTPEEMRNHPSRGSSSTPGRMTLVAGSERMPMLASA